MPIQMPFDENGVRVHFPDNNTFRLSDCPAYIAISTNSVKEMDIGWYEAATDTLWMVELKAFHNAEIIGYRPKDLSDPTIVEAVFDNLLGKSIHTICQINTNRAGTQNCVGHPITNNTNIKLVHLVKTMPGQETYLNPLQDKLREKLKPFLAIFNIAAVAIVSYDFAVMNRLPSWVV